MIPVPTKRLVIDVCGSAFDADGWRSYLLRYAHEAPGYVRSFGRRLAIRAGIPADSYDDACAVHPALGVELLVNAGALGTSPADHVASLRAQGVRHQVLQGGSPDRFGDDLNARAAAWAQTDPELLQAWAGLNLADPSGSVAELERCVGELGMRGAYVTPFFDGVAADAASCEPIYARAEELGVPIWIHVGMTLAANRPMCLSTWDSVDRIAIAHPDLVILVGHGGWPWLIEAMAVLQRHPNVYLDFSAYRPRHVAHAGSGWEPLLHYGNTVLRHKVLFGSVAWIHRSSIGELADEIRNLPIDEGAAQAWLHDNAARILDLDSGRSPAFAGGRAAS